MGGTSMQDRKTKAAELFGQRYSNCIKNTCKELMKDDSKFAEIKDDCDKKMMGATMLAVMEETSSGESKVEGLNPLDDAAPVDEWTIGPFFAMLPKEGEISLTAQWSHADLSEFLGPRACRANA